MRRMRLFPQFATIFLVAALLSSCSPSSTVSDDEDTSLSGSTIVVSSPTKASVSALTPTPKPTAGAIPTCRPIATPTPTGAVPLPAAADPGYTYYSDKNGEMYIVLFTLTDLPATVVDTDVRDGIEVKADGDSIRVPAGTVLFPFEPDKDFYMAELNEDTLFILSDGRAVSFHATKTADGIQYDGKAADQVLGGRFTFDSDEGYRTRTADLGVLTPDSPLRSDYTYKSISIQVDWNGDGKTDAFTRTSAPQASSSGSTAGNEGQRVSVIYTDGATGKTTDVTDLLGKDADNDNVGFTDSVFLYKAEDGNRYLVDSVSEYDSYVMTYVYSYDARSIVSAQTVNGKSGVLDGQAYLYTWSTVFGNLDYMETPLVASGGTLIPKASEESNWAEYNPSISWAFRYDRPFTFTIADVRVECASGDTYTATELVPGTVIFPEKVKTDVDGKGYVYFSLVDGRECRASLRIDKDQCHVYFGGVEQQDVFHCGFGG